MKRRLLLLSLTALLFAALYTSNAYATGGAYTSTKHGGGTTDGAAPFGGGVQRGVNPAYATGIYDTVNPDAGQYQAGECSHCHEAHASFGGSEPLPNTTVTGDTGGGPNPYLLLADNKPETCYYCHESLSNIGGSGSPLGWGRWSYYRGKSYYDATGHNTNAAMKSYGYGAGQPWPRTSRQTNLTGGECINCHAPHGILSTAATYDIPTAALPNGVPAAKQTTAGNPNVSKDYLIPRMAVAWEEKLCLNCHDGTNPAAPPAVMGIECLPQALGCQGIAGNPKGSGHPVYDVDECGSSGAVGCTGVTFSGRHSLANEANPTAGSWNAYSNNTRHVECMDCHNPHATQRGTTWTAPWNYGTAFQRSGESFGINPNRYAGPNGIYAGGANKGVWGVAVTNITTGALGGRVEDTNTAAQSYSGLYQYQICLKCHSVFADSSFGTATAPQTASFKNRARWPGFDLGLTVPPRYTNVALDFATDSYYTDQDTLKATLNKGYHPVYTTGRNQPADNANCRWTNLTITAGAPCPPLGGSQEVAGRNTGTRNTTLGFSNTLVPPWTKSSMIACADCHHNDPTSPRGPHGSSRPYILRRLDNAITYTLANGEVVNYAAFNGGWQTGNAFGFGPVDLTTYDLENICLNCHRADVYGFFRQITARNTVPIGGTACAAGGGAQDNCYPRYRYLSRQPHPADDMETYSFSNAAESGDAGPAPRGNVCLRCHGGGTTGGIHGNSGAAWLGQSAAACKTLTLANTTANCYIYDLPAGFTPTSNRLLNGVAWTGVRFGSTTAAGACRRASTNYNPLNNVSCVNDTSAGNFTKNATYNY